MVEFYDEGEQNWYELEDETFPGLAAKMEALLKNKWTHFADKRKYPDTVKWFIACCAPVYISSELNPAIYGSAYKEPENITAQRKELYESWGFNKKADFLEMLPKLYEGRAMQTYSKDWENFDQLDEDKQGMTL